MAIINGVISAPGEAYDGATVQVNIPTVRVPELPAADLPFDTDDKFPIWDSSRAKTAWVGPDDLITYLAGGGVVTTGGSGGSSTTTGEIIQIIATATNGAGTNRIDDARLAGLTYELSRRGPGELRADEWNNLSTGGFTLNDIAGVPQIIGDGETFFAKTFTFGAPPDPTGTAGSLFNGFALLSSDITLTAAAHLNKLLHIAGGSSALAIVLPDLADVPDNTVMVLETSINNTKKTSLSTPSAQNIYYNSTASEKIYLGPSEFLWLFKWSDGWYVINASPSFLHVGEPFLSYKEVANTILAQGQIILRADEPRLWAFVQTLGPSLVSDSTWIAPDFLTGLYSYRGCFSSGDGSTTFRLPDLRNQFFRGLNNIGGSDSERPNNNPGGRQKEDLLSHGHSINTTNSSASGNDGSDAVRGTTPGTVNTRGQAGPTKTIGLTGGVETRPINTGFLPLIRT